MAFFSKAGNILRQAVSKQHINQEISASRSSIFQFIRCMSSSKLFVGGISWNTSDDSLRQAFSKYGEVVEARVIYDRESGRSRGFGFVTFNNSEDASAAIQALDQQELDGRRIRVNIANDRTRGYGGGGDFGGRGNFGAGGYGGGGSYGAANYDGAGGNYGATGYGGGSYGATNYDSAGGSYGVAGQGSGGSYSSAEGGQPNYAGNYGSSGSSFGFETSGGSNYSSGDSQNLGAAGEGNVFGDAASNNFTSSFGDGSAGLGSGSNDQLHNDNIGSLTGPRDDNSPVENYGDDNEEPKDYANRA